MSDIKEAINGARHFRVEMAKRKIKRKILQQRAPFRSKLFPAFRLKTTWGKG